MLLLYRVGCLYRVVAGGEIPECVWLVSVWGWTYLLDAGQGRRRVCTLQINGLKPLLLLLIASKWRMPHTDLGFFGCVEYFNFIMSPNFEKRLEMSQLLTPIFKMKNGWVKNISVWLAKLFLRFKFEGSNLCNEWQCSPNIFISVVWQILHGSRNMAESFEMFSMFTIPVHIDFGLRFQNIW